MKKRRDRGWPAFDCAWVDGMKLPAPPLLTSLAHLPIRVSVPLPCPSLSLSHIFWPKNVASTFRSFFYTGRVCAFVGVFCGAEPSRQSFYSLQQHNSMFLIVRFVT
jgi:hypothetical protein